MIYKDKGIIYSNYVLDNLSNIVKEKELIVMVETFYNCREMGYVFNIHNEEYTDKLYIWVYAHRNSDKPTIVYGKTTDGNNMFNEEQWEKQETFEDINKAVEYVEEVIRENI